jgi:hypothetical protein
VGSTLRINLSGCKYELLRDVAALLDFEEVQTPTAA